MRVLAGDVITLMWPSLFDSIYLLGKKFSTTFSLMRLFLPAPPLPADFWHSSKKNEKGRDWHLEDFGLFQTFQVSLRFQHETSKINFRPIQISQLDEWTWLDVPLFHDVFFFFGTVERQKAPPPFQKYVPGLGLCSLFSTVLELQFGSPEETRVFVPKCRPPPPPPPPASNLKVSIFYLLLPV